MVGVCVLSTGDGIPTVEGTGSQLFDWHRSHCDSAAAAIRSSSAAH